MTETQRAAALRLIDPENAMDTGEWIGDAADLLRELAAEPKPAIERFNETEGVDAMSPLERLRFFCSLAMGGQDWLDVEPFFDALASEPVQEPVAWWCKHPRGGGFMTCDELAAQHYMHKFRNAGENGPTLAPLYAAPQQIGLADIETKNEQHDLHRRSVEIMSKALEYSERMTDAMERIAAAMPQQRQPLTDEQINRLDTEAIHGGPDSQYAFRFARAIEKAITGETP